LKLPVGKAAWRCAARPSRARWQVCWLGALWLSPLLTLAADPNGLPLVTTEQPASHLLALVGGTVWTGTAAPPIVDGVVLIDNDRIVAVGPAATTPVPAGAMVVSTEGMTVLPGLMDLAVQNWRLGHGLPTLADPLLRPLAERVIMPWALLATTAAGVTSVTEWGTPAGVATELRDRVAARRLPGPRVRVAGPVLERQTRSVGDAAWRWPVRSVTDARDKVRRLLRLGVDQVVIAAPEEWPAADLAVVVSVARAAQRPVWAEVRRSAGIAVALEAGVEGLLGLGLDTAPEWPPEVLFAVRARALAGHPVAWAVQLAPVAVDVHWRQDAEALDDPRLYAGLPLLLAQDLRASWKPYTQVPPVEFAALRLQVAGARVRALRDAGVRIVLASGAGRPGLPQMLALQVEAEALVREAGFSPDEVLRAATVDAALASGVTKGVPPERVAGQLVVGAVADVIAVRGAVLEDVGRLREVAVVVAAGRRMK
jgi:imidazolonepropionase-like amidohydrolase